MRQCVTHKAPYVCLVDEIGSYSKIIYLRYQILGVRTNKKKCIYLGWMQNMDLWKTGVCPRLCNLLPIATSWTRYHLNLKQNETESACVESPKGDGSPWQTGDMAAETWVIYGNSTLLVEFIYLVFAHMPGEVAVGGSGLCCCVPCLSSAIISFRLVMGTV